jgi:dolichol-phosphate mannosyltransferase
MPHPDDPPELSVVVPAHDEEGNVLLLVKGLAEALEGISHEIVLVDDASTDGTRAEMIRARESHPQVRIVARRKRSGKSGALWSGFRHARGRMVATCDADLQNDPRDVVRCFRAMTSDLDVVNGKRDRSKDGRIRHLSSRIGNGFRRAVLHGPLTDAGTGIRVFRRECLPAILPFEGAHRFFGELVAMHGFRCAEIPIEQRPRHAGVAKYGVGNRALRGLVDVLAIKWLERRIVTDEGEEVP